jgi:membrane-bound lytic murein transglycosylase B
MKHTKRFLTALALGLSLSLAAPIQAQAPVESFTEYLARVAQDAKAEGVRQDVLDQVLPTLYYDPEVTAHDKAQPGAQMGVQQNVLANYLRAHVTPVRARTGKAKSAQYAAHLETIEAKTGVAAPILLSIWANESDFKAAPGQYDLLNALASLSYQGRRRDMFSHEFIATLKLIQRGIPRNLLHGSWAGATGMPQFMPSQVEVMAVDGDGDGRIDIWYNPVDALASIGNYLYHAGWQAHVPWGVRVSLPPQFDMNLYASVRPTGHCAKASARLSVWKPLREWQALGVAPLREKNLSPDEPMSLLQPDGPGHNAWLTSINYRKILAYNCSNLYGLSVGSLADAIEY